MIEEDGLIETVAYGSLFASFVLNARLVCLLCFGSLFNTSIAENFENYYTTSFQKSYQDVDLEGSNSFINKDGSVK